MWSEWPFGVQIGAARMDGWHGRHYRLRQIALNRYNPAGAKRPKGQRA